MSSKNIARSALWVTVSEIIFNLSGYVIHSFVGRILGPADYGRYGLVVTLTTMVIILIGNGIPTAMSKYISEFFEINPGRVKTIKRQAVLLQSVLIGAVTVIFYFSTGLIARVLGDPSLEHLFKISTLIIPSFAAASFYFSYYTGLHEFNLQSILKTLRSFLKVVTIVGFAYLYKVEGSITGYIAAPAILFIIGWLIDEFKVSRKLEESAKTQTETNIDFDWKKLTTYAWQIVIFFLAYELLISIDLYLVQGILRDDYLTGIYNASLTVGRIPYYIFYALTIILLPVISKTTSQNDHAETNKIISQSLRLMLILLVPGVILMSVYARPIIKIFYSAKYIDAAYPMSILAYGVGFLTIFYVMSFVMNGAGKTKIPMWISIAGVFLNTVLNYILIKRYALSGSAIATSITSFVVMALMLYYLYRDFGTLIKIKSALKILSAGALMYAASLFFSRGEFIFLLWSLILFTFYFLALYVMGEIKKEDLIFLKNIVSRKKVSEVEAALPGTEPSA